MNDKYKELYESYLNQTYDEFKKKSKKISKDLTDNPEKTELEFQEAYPDYDDENFNQKIYNKKEFNMFKNNVSETNNNDADFDTIANDICTPKNFTLTNAQKFLKNFMSKNTLYNSLLLFHGVGQGKTCTAISIVENFDNYYNKPALIILSSTLKDNFKKQIFDISKLDITTKKLNLCTGNKYLDMISDKDDLENEVIEWRINKLIDQKYQFMGYKELTFHLEKIKKKIQNTVENHAKVEELFEEKISDIFSNRLIIIDEAHNLRADEKGDKQTSISFKKIISNVVNVKLLLLTATPMFDNAKEIIWLINLLLLNNKKKELTNDDIFNNDDTLKENGEEIFKKNTIGLVSYLNYKSPYAFPYRLFPSINNDSNLIKNFPKIDIYGNNITDVDKIKNLEIIGSKISTYQEKVYDKIKDNIIEINTSSRDNTTNVALQDGTDSFQITTQLNNIAYPAEHINRNNCIGDSGMNKNFIIYANGKRKYIDNENQFLSYNKIEKYAPKIKKILDYVINSTGIVFIYSRYYSSGVIPIALALEHIGMSKYNNNNLGVGLKIDKKISGNYIILSGDKSFSPNNNKEIAEVKSKKNKNGNNIKVIIGTKVSSEGIDFKNIREIHLLEPWYNLNMIEQIIGRGIRYCSHIDLPKEERNTTIMFHSITLKNSNIESYDLRMYRKAEKKQNAINDIEKILINNSIDCLLNKSDEKIKDFIKIKTSQGVEIKKYKPDDANAYDCNITGLTENDESTFNKNFIINEIDIYKLYIEDIFFTKKEFYLTYNKLLKFVKEIHSGINEEIFIYTLDHLLTNKIILNNISNNKKYYLIYKSNYYILKDINDIDEYKTLDEIKKNNNYVTSIVLKSNDKQKSINKTDKNVEKNEDIVKLINDKYNSKLNSLLYYFYDYVFKKNYNVNILRTYKTKPHISKFLLEIYGIITIKSDSETDKNERNKYTKQIGEIVEEFKEVIYDSILDRLEENEFTKLIIYVIKTKDEIFLNRLIRTNVFIFENSNELKYFYNKYTKDFYSISNEEIIKTNILHLSNLQKKYKTQYDEINNNIKNNLLNKTRGYVYNNNFKIKNNDKNIGYVCDKTSTLKIDILKEIINKLKPNFIGDNKKLINKPNLCYIYELLMRLYNTEKFQRPHFISLQTKTK
jgi:superfamily II DNA or RNA helicase